MEITPLFTAEFIVKKDDYNEFMRFMYLKKNIAGTVLSIAFILLFLYMLIRGIIIQQKLIVMFFGVFLFTYGFSMLRQHIGAYNNYKSNFGKKCTYLFFNEFYSIDFNNKQSNHNFSTVYETDKYYYFMLSKRQAVFIRKDSLEENSAEAFRNYIIEKSYTKFKSYV